MPRTNTPPKNVYLRFGSDAFQHETEKARLLVIDNEQIWLPKSQIIHFAEEGDTVAITLPDWIAEKNNLLDHIDPEWIIAGCPD